METIGAAAPEFVSGSKTAGLLPVSPRTPHFASLRRSHGIHMTVSDTLLQDEPVLGVSPSAPGPGVRASSFSSAAEWHLARKRAILAAHPAVAELQGRDRRTLPALFAVNLAQWSACFGAGADGFSGGASVAAAGVEAPHPMAAAAPLAEAVLHPLADGRS